MALEDLRGRLESVDRERERKEVKERMASFYASLERERESERQEKQREARERARQEYRRRQQEDLQKEWRLIVYANLKVLAEQKWGKGEEFEFKTRIEQGGGDLLFITYDVLKEHPEVSQEETGYLGELFSVTLRAHFDEEDVLVADGFLLDGGDRYEASFEALQDTLVETYEFGPVSYGLTSRGKRQS